MEKNKIKQGMSFSRFVRKLVKSYTLGNDSEVYNCLRKRALGSSPHRSRAESRARRNDIPTWLQQRESPHDKNSGTTLYRQHKSR